MVRYIAKCRTCKHIAARDYTETTQIEQGTGMYRRMATVYGRTAYGRFIRASKDYFCPSCNAQTWEGQRIEGTTTEHVCDVRCTDAKGFRCECSCGGANHGQGFLCEGVA
jgi:hypothetical protein